MATIDSGIVSRPGTCKAPDWQNRLAELRAFWRQLVARTFNPYRPELHYMRGPGPAWRAKHLGRQNWSLSRLFGACPCV